MKRGPRAAAAFAIAAILIALALLARSCGGPDGPGPLPAGPGSGREPPPRGSPNPEPGTPAGEAAAPEIRGEAVPPADPPAVGDPVPSTGIRIHGRVVDEGRTGVAGAGIELRAWSGTEPDIRWSTILGVSGADGAFELVIDRGLATKGFGVATTADGFVEALRIVKPGEYDEEAGLEVVVEPGRAVVGRVLDEYGGPIPGTVVLLWYGSETTWPTEAGADGRFRTPRHGPVRAFNLVIEAPGFPRRTVPLPDSVEDPTDAGDLVFRRGGSLSGIVVDGAGVPVPDLPLVLLGVAGPIDRAPRARTDGGGRFEFAELGEGAVDVCVDGPAGGTGRSWRGLAEDVEVGTRDLRVVVRTEARVVLRFVDAATGRPVDVGKAEYGLREEGTPEPERLGHGASSTDPLLSTILSAWPGRYDLTVRSPGFEVVRVHGFEVQDIPEVTLDVPMRRLP